MMCLHASFWFLNVVVCMMVLAFLGIVFVCSFRCFFLRSVDACVSNVAVADRIEHRMMDNNNVFMVVIVFVGYGFCFGVRGMIRPRGWRFLCVRVNRVAPGGHGFRPGGG